MPTLIEQLLSIVGSTGIITGPKLLDRNNGYLDSSALRAKAVVTPVSTNQVSKLLSICDSHKQSIVPHGGLTNLVYSTYTTENDIALSMEKMNNIESIDKAGKIMTVQAGATLQLVQDAARDAGLFFPLDIESRGSATIGGNIATNAGGTRVLRYGMMRDLVLGLEVVLADGTILTSMNKMLKNNTGYDLKQLFIGSEGTLGVITRAVLRLWPLYSDVFTALLGIQSFDQVVSLLTLAQNDLGDQLTSFEVMWGDYYKLTTTPPAPTTPPMVQNYKYYVLIECLGTKHNQDKIRFEDFLNDAFSKGLFVDAVIPGSSEQRKTVWKIRMDTEQIDAQKKPFFSFDVSLPIISMEQYVNDVYDALRADFGEINYWVYGHIADGNLHISLSGPHISENEGDPIQEMVYRHLEPFGGSISGEHGIGLERKKYLHYSRSYEEISIMRKVKLALDPNGIINPGKIFDLS